MRSPAVRSTDPGTTKEGKPKENQRAQQMPGSTLAGGVPHLPVLPAAESLQLALVPNPGGAPYHAMLSG